MSLWWDSKSHDMFINVTCKQVEKYKVDSILYVWINCTYIAIYLGFIAFKKRSIFAQIESQWYHLWKTERVVLHLKLKTMGKVTARDTGSSQGIQVAIFCYFKDFQKTDLYSGRIGIKRAAANCVHGYSSWLHIFC